MQRRCVVPTADFCEPTAVLIRGGGRWVASNELPGGGQVFVRLDDHDRVVELYLNKGGEEITPTDLRQLPLTRIRTEAASRPDLWMFAEMDPKSFKPVDLYAAMGEAFPQGWLDGGVAKDELAQSFELSASSANKGLTDGFLRDVACAYRDAASRGLRPNVALAEQTGAARRTVEKWVYLARKKGFLPATRPGRVG
jgi:hypothetical protein